MIVVVSDIHANLPALDAVLAEIPPISALWVLGDTVGETAQPCETLERLFSLPFPMYAVMGNREESLLEAKEGKCAAWWRGTQFRLPAWTVEKLKPSHWEWMQRLPLTVELPFGSNTALLCHGSPLHTRDKMNSEEALEEALYGQEATLLLCGHTHRVGERQYKEKKIVNAGSVGISLDGIGGTACYTLLNEETGAITQRKVAYNAEETIKAIQNSALPELAPGVTRAIILELRSGRSHLMGLLEFCQRYAKKQYGITENPLPDAIWREAEQKWDGTEWLPGRK